MPGHDSVLRRQAEAHALWIRFCQPLTHIPKDDLRAAAEYRDELVPLLIETVRDGVVNADKYIENPALYGPILGMLLLAQFREQRGCAAILDFFRRPDAVLDLQVGDMATEDLMDLICSTYDGNFDALRAIVEDESVGAYAAESVIHAAGALCRADLIGLDDLRSWFVDLFESPRSATNWIAGALASVSAAMSFKSLRGSIRRLYDGGFIDDDLIPKSEIAQVFAGISVVGYPHVALVVDAERRLERWIDKSSDDARLAGPWHTPEPSEVDADKPNHYDRKAIETTFVREEPKIGRNDPCPCRSGRKYKKCCGKLA